MFSIINRLFGSSEENQIVIFNTNHSELPGQSYKTGVYLPELVLPTLELCNSGFKNIKFASPKGGVIPIDEDSVERFGKKDPYIKFLNDPKWMEMLKNSSKPSDFLDARNVSAVIFTGGVGSLWDLYDDSVAKVAANVYENGGVVGAIDCGGVVLTKIKLQSGKKLVDKKRITCLSDAELNALELGDILPRKVEQLVRKESEAKVVFRPQWESNVVVEERLVTGQNFASSEEFAKNIVKLLKK